ncbi:MAG: phage scaffolding protein, partial [Methanoregula sp.]
GAKNMKAVKAIIDLEKVQAKDGAITGLDEQIVELKKSDAYLFGGSAANNEGGLNPNNSVPPKDDKYADLRILR